MVALKELQKLRRLPFLYGFSDIKVIKGLKMKSCIQEMKQKPNDCLKYFSREYDSKL